MGNDGKREERKEATLVSLFPSITHPLFLHFRLFASFFFEGASAAERAVTTEGLPVVVGEKGGWGCMFLSVLFSKSLPCSPNIISIFPQIQFYQVPLFPEILPHVPLIPKTNRDIFLKEKAGISPRKNWFSKLLDKFYS